MMELIFFMIGVAVISLSGTMSPGPLTAFLISKSHEDKYAGIYVTLGHMVIEIPLVLLIGFGFAQVFQGTAAKIFISLIGGPLIIFMGYSLIKKRNEFKTRGSRGGRNSIIGGAVGTLSPYFFVWWATLGAALILKSFTFGLIGFVLLIVAHLSTNFGWHQMLSYSVNRTKGLWTIKTHRMVFVSCGIFLILFGLYFLTSIAEFL